MILSVVYCPCPKNREERVVLLPQIFHHLYMYSHNYTFRCMSGGTKFGLTGCFSPTLLLFKRCNQGKWQRVSFIAITVSITSPDKKNSAFSPVLCFLWVSRWYHFVLLLTCSGHRHLERTLYNGLDKIDYLRNDFKENQQFILLASGELFLS